MSTKYIASNWRLPNEENSNKNDNYGLSFNGSNSIITCGNLTQLQGATNASFSMWVNVATSGIEYFFSQWGSGTDRLIRTFVNGLGTSSNQLDIYINDGIRFRASNNSIIESIATGEWFNLIITYDGTQSTSSQRVKAYINNQELTGNVFGGPTSLYSSTTDFIIGGNPSGATYFEGKISEFSIFDYTLSSTQISTLYGSSSLGAGNPMALKPQPVAYYPLGDNSASNPLIQPNEAVEDASVFDFDAASSNYINIYNGTIGNLPSQFSIGASDSYSFSFWIKSNVTTSNNFFYTQRGSAPYLRFYTTYISGDDSYRAYFVVRDDSSVQISENSDSTNLVNRNEWNHIVGIIDRSASKLYVYVNGVVTGTGTSLGSLGAITQVTDVAIGGDPYPSGSIRFEFDGEISNTQIWNTALSASDVTTLYNSGVPLLTGTQPQASSLMAWYKLDQSANWDVSSSGNWTIPDASGNGNDGTSSGMTSANLVLSDLTRAVPYNSYSFHFDTASADYINLGSPSALDFETGEMTLSCWINLGTLSGIKPILGNSNSALNIYQYLLDVNRSAGKITFLMKSPSNFSFVSNSTITANTWYHICITRSGTTSNWVYTMYINGSSSDGATKSTTVNPPATETIAIGRYGAAGGYYFQGEISNVSMFDEALTSTEVMKLYANGVPQNLTNFTQAPVAWYPLGSNSFWNGSQWTVRDMSTGGSNDGTGVNLGQDALVGNSPRSTAGGTGSNMDIPTNLEGSTKWSSNNSWSINMSSTARVEDTP